MASWFLGYLTRQTVKDRIKGILDLFYLMLVKTVFTQKEVKSTQNAKKC